MGFLGFWCYNTKIVCEDGKVKSNTNLSICLPHTSYARGPTSEEYRTTEALLKYNVESEDEGELEASEYLERESLSSQEVREIQAQEYTHLKNSPRGKRRSPAAKGSTQ